MGFLGIMVSVKMNLAEIIEELPKLTAEQRQAIYRQIEELTASRNSTQLRRRAR
jgi:hypothetical protein